MESFGFKGTFQSHLVQPPCIEHGDLQLEQDAQSPEVEPHWEC